MATYFRAFKSLFRSGSVTTDTSKPPFPSSEPESSLPVLSSELWGETKVQELCDLCWSDFHIDDVLPDPVIIVSLRYRRLKQSAERTECFFCQRLSYGRARLTECINWHPAGIGLGEVTLPARLLDVGSLDGIQMPFLRITREDPSLSGPYAALSYCWGTSPAFTTSVSTLHERRQGIPLISLPKTLRDAVYITRRLGIQYLWIDALCILQGSDEEAHSDWEMECAKMDLTYGNAILTISAAASDDCQGGILGLRFTPAVKEQLHGGSMLEEPINHRAWTLQERLLSARILSFGVKEVVWTCHSKTMREGGNNRGVDHVDNMVSYPLFDGDSRQRWSQLLQDYTSRDLTRDGDKLPALSGIARRFQKHTGDDYLAGLWTQDLLRSLLWKAERLVLHHTPNSRPSSYRAPSWSWASINGNVRHITLQVEHFYAEIIKCSVEPASDLDPFGSIRGGKLLIRGPLKRASAIGWGKSDHDRWLLDSKPTSENDAKLGPAWPDINDQDLFDSSGELQSGSPWCLNMASNGTRDVVLFMDRISNTEAQYRRIGIAQIEQSFSWFSNASTETITIL